MKKKLLSVVLALAMAFSLLPVTALADTGTTKVTFTPVNGNSVTYMKSEDSTSITLYFEDEELTKDYAVASYALNGKQVSFMGATLRSVNDLMRAYWEVCKASTGCDYNAAMLPENGTGTLTWTIHGTVNQGEYTNSGALNLPALSGGYIWNNGGYAWKNIVVTADTDGAAIVSNDTFDVAHSYISTGTTSTTFTGIVIDGSVYAIPKEASALTFENCVFKGMLRAPSGNGTVKVQSCQFVGDGDGDSNDTKNEYPFFYQAGGTLEFTGNTVANNVYKRGLNVGGVEDLNATISGNTIGIVTEGYSAIQLAGGVKKAKIQGNNIALENTNAFTLHSSLLKDGAKPVVTIQQNTITGTGYLLYDDAAATGKSFSSDKLALTINETVPPTVDTTKGVKGDKVTELTGYVAAVAQGKDIAGKVAQVGTEYFDSFENAFAALNADNHTLTLIDGSAWPADKPVYWKVGDGQWTLADTLANALTAAYKANTDGKGDITIVCRPGADVGKMTHGHVADNLTIYGNNAWISGGECDLEVDTYKYSRTTGSQAPDGEFLAQNITITAYELDNLGVWGQRNTSHAIDINLNDCDSRFFTWTDNNQVKHTNSNQRVYITSGPNKEGTNNITLVGCDFKRSGNNDVWSSVYSNADGIIKIDGCVFDSVAVPVNLNHKALGTQSITIRNSAFANCGTVGDAAAKYAAPVRFVNSGGGTQNAAVDSVIFTDTVGNNGDILIGDGQTGVNSGDVTLTVTNTAANVQAQKPGYYNGATTDVTKVMAVTVAEKDTLTTSVSKLLPNAAKIGEVEYATLKEALESLKNSNEKTVTIQLLADQNVAGFTVDLSGSKIESLTIQGNGKKLDSLVENGDQNGERGGPRLPVIDVNMKDGANLVVDNAVFPNSLIFDDTTSKASVTIQNCTFRKTQAGYPKAKEITYDHNTFDFNGDLEKKTGTGGDLYYTHNAYPLWFIVEQSQKIVLTNNTVTGYPRGFHIETRSEALGQGIVVNNNTFNLIQCCKEHNNKRVALQLVGAKLNGNVEFQNNNVDAYMGVCFFKNGSGGITVTESTNLTIQNNYTTGKLYGSNEWSTVHGSTEADRIAAADKFAQELVEGAGSDSTVTEGHTHNYVDGTCTICGQDKPSSGGSSSSYTVNVEDSKNGTVTVSPKNASKNTTVTLTVKADKGYELDTLTVTDKNGKELKLTDKGNGKYTFTMPAGKVDVKATFAKIVEAPAYSDVSASAWYADAVAYVTDKGMMEGDSGKFMPLDKLTRSQMAQVLFNLEGKKSVNYALTFGDMNGTEWYGEAVRWAASEQIVNGYDNGNFGPNDPITREQLVTILYRYAQYKGLDTATTEENLTSFADAAQVSGYAVSAMNWAVGAGVINGTDSGLAPKATATRAEVAQILMNFDQKF